QAVIVDEDHSVLGSSRRQTPTSGGPAAVASEMEIALRDAAKAAEIEPAELAGVGVGSPGVIEDGNVRGARNLPDWEGTFPLAATLQDALGCEVRVGNDVQVATDAEFGLGAGRLYSSLLGVFWGTGVGGGLILAGERWITGTSSRARCSTGRSGRSAPGSHRSSTCSTSRAWSSAAAWGSGSATPMPNASPMRCSRTCSTTRSHRMSTSPRSGTWAARSAPRC